MDYTAAAPPPADPRPTHPQPILLALAPYSYAPYHQLDASASGSAASATSYNSNPTAPADTLVSPAVAYYLGAVESSQATTISAQVAPAATGRDAGQYFGSDPQRCAQASAVKALNGIASADVATVMHCIQWNAHVTPEDLEVKKRRVLEAGAPESEVKICTACSIIVNSQIAYEHHIAGQKHKANVQKPQLEVKKRRVLAAGAAKTEVKICTACQYCRQQPDCVRETYSWT